MRHITTSRVLLILSAFWLTACGGGEGTFFQDNRGGAAEEAQLDRLEELLIVPSDTQLANDAADPNGEGGVTLTIVALDGNRNVLSGIPVFITAVGEDGSGDGVISVPSGGTGVPVTDSSGTVVARLTTGGDSSDRIIRVVAQAGDVVSTPVGISVVDPAAIVGGAQIANLRLLASDTVLPQDLDPANEGVSLTAIVTDENGNLVSGADVTFTVSVSSAALRIDRATTDNSGTALALLTTGGISTPGPVTVQAFVNGLPAVSDSVTVEILERVVGDVTLLPSATEIRANNTDVVTISVLTQDGNNFSLAGVPVLFESDFGRLTAPAGSAKASALRVTSNAEGIATAELRTGGDFTDLEDFSDAQIEVTITVGSGSNTTTRTLVINVVDPDAVVDLPPVERVSLILSADTLPADASSLEAGVGVTAVVATAQGVVVPDVPVTFSLEFSSSLQATRPVALQVDRGTTDASGTATGTLVASSNNVETGTVTVTATAQGEDGPVSGSATLRLVDAVGTIELQAADLRLDAVANASTQITAFARGPTGQALNGVQVEFATTSGTLSSGVATTSGDGRATTQLSIGGNTTPRVITVSASTAGLNPTSLDITVGEAVGEVQLTADVSQIENDPADPASLVNLTVTVLNQQRAPLADIPVTLEVTSGAANLQLNDSRTGADGTVTATLRPNENTVVGSGSIQLRAQAGGTSDTLRIDVVPDSDPPPDDAAQILLLSSDSSLRSDRNRVEDGLTLTAIVLDAAGRALADVRVAFSVASDSSPAGALQVTRAVTDVAGTAEAILTTAGNQRNRDIRVTASAPPASPAVITIPVVGTNLSVSGPLSVGLGNAARFTATLQDGGGFGIPGRNVLISSANGNQLSATQAVTDADGQVEFSVTGSIGETDRQPDVITVTAFGGSVSDTAELTVSQFALRFLKPGEGDEILLEDDPGTPQLDNEREVRVRLFGPSNAPVVGETINFATSRGALNANTAMTGGAVDVNGVPGYQVGEVGLLNDLNGDGVFDFRDLALLDTDASGTVSLAELQAFDGDGDGTTVGGGDPEDSALLDLNEDGVVDGADVTLFNDIFTSDTSMLSVNGDFALDQADYALLDPNGDGVFDAEELQALLATDIDGNGDNFAADGDPVDAALLDTNGDGVFDGTDEANLTAVVEQLGIATVTLTATSSDGNGPVILNAIGPGGAADSVGVEFVAPNPFRVDLQVQPTTININGTGTVVAVVRDASNNLVKNQIVEFRIEDPTGGSLSAASAITNSQGVATVTYQASSTSSAFRGVIVRGFIPGNFESGVIPCNDVDGDGTDAEDTTGDMVRDGTSDANGTGADGNLLCDLVGVTIGNRALRITMGTGNELVERDTTTYDMPWRVLVTDPAGNPAPQETITRIRIRVLEYEKGDSVFADPIWVRRYTVSGVQGLNWPANAGCPNEDIDLDGILDPGEDINGDGELTPSPPTSVPATLDLDEQGAAEFNVTYAQDVAYWVRVEMAITASVAGTETTESRRFVLPGTANDFNNEDTAPPGEFSPYGVNGCADPN